MRPIKFKGKRVDNGEWIYGDSCSVGDKRYIVRRETAEIINCCPSIPQKVHGIVFAVEVHPETVGQFTGETDKNNKEIYGGIRFGNGWTKGGDLITSSRNTSWKSGEVLYRSSAFRIHAFILCHLLPNCEVIGNATDNPELLE